jgi:hypothetical protein
MRVTRKERRPTMPDKEQLTKLLSDYGISDRYIDDLCDEIEECFAPVLADVEKWRIMEKVVMADECLSEQCPVFDICQDDCDGFICEDNLVKFVHALEGEGEKG